MSENFSVVWGMAHRQKGIFIGWALGPGIPVWSSDLTLLKSKSPSAYFARIMSAPIPQGTAEDFTSNDTGWQAGHLLEREPEQVLIFEIPAHLINKPKNETIQPFLEILKDL